MNAAGTSRRRESVNEVLTCGSAVHSGWREATVVATLAIVGSAGRGHCVRLALHVLRRRSVVLLLSLLLEVVLVHLLSP